MVKNKSEIRRKAKLIEKARIEDNIIKNNPINGMFGSQEFIEAFNEGIKEELNKSITDYPINLKPKISFITGIHIKDVDRIFTIKDIQC